MVSCLISQLETLAGSGSVCAEADVEGVRGGVAHRRQGAPTQVTILAAALQYYVGVHVDYTQDHIPQKPNDKISQK